MSLKCSVLKSGYCEITQGFGGSNNHRGLDLVGKGYTLDDVVSYSDGNVLMSVTGYGNGQGEGVNWRYGNFVKILHDDGTICLYAHLERTSVSVGQRVSKGQVIGKMGNSGNSFGAHLHWEYWSKNDYYSNVDPSPYLQPKEPIVLPKVVERDKNKRQFQVDYNDNLRIRKTASLNGEVLGILNAGIYDFTESKTAEGYLWVKVGSDMWCACTSMSRILEIEKEEPKEEIKENVENTVENSVEKVENSVENEEPIINDLEGNTATKEENNTNTLEDNEQCQEQPKNEKIGIIKWLLEALIDILKKILEKM